MRQADSQRLVGPELEDPSFLSSGVDAFSGLPDPGPEWFLPGNGSSTPDQEEPTSGAMEASAEARDVDKAVLGDFSDLLDLFAHFLDGEEALETALVDASAAVPDEALFNISGLVPTEADSGMWTAPPPPSPAPALQPTAFVGSSDNLSLSRSTSSSGANGTLLHLPLCVGASLSSSHEWDLGPTHLDTISESSQPFLEDGNGGSGVPSPSPSSRRSHSQSSSSSNSGTPRSSGVVGVAGCVIGGEAGNSGPTLLDKLKNLVNGSGSSASVPSGAAETPAPSQATSPSASQVQEEDPSPSAPEGQAAFGRAAGGEHLGLLLKDALGLVDFAAPNAGKGAQQVKCGGSVEEGKEELGEEGDEEGGCGKDSGDDEQQRQQRLLRNRQSALQSRQRRKMYVTELEQRCRMLEVQLGQMRQIVAMTAMENGALRDQVMRLQQQLPAHPQAQTQPQKQAQTETQASRPASPSSSPQSPPNAAIVTAPTLDNGSSPSLPDSAVTAAVTSPALSHRNVISQSQVSGLPGSRGGVSGVSEDGVVGGLGRVPGVVQHGAEPAALNRDPLQSGSVCFPHPLLAACLALHLSLLILPSAFSLSMMAASHSLLSVLACLLPPRSVLSRGPSPVFPLHLYGLPPLWEEAEQGHGAGGAGRLDPSWLAEVGVAGRGRALALPLPRRLLPPIPLAPLCPPVTPVLLA